jgi:hypothetical protein
MILLQSSFALPLLGQQIQVEHPAQWVPFLQSSDFLNRINWEGPDSAREVFKDLHEDLRGAAQEEVKREEEEMEEECGEAQPTCSWVLDAALYNTRLVDILQKCSNDIARTCPKELKKRSQKIEKLQQSLLSFGVADTQFQALSESLDEMPEHCTARSKACNNKEFINVMSEKEHSRRKEMPMVRQYASRLQTCKKKSYNVVQMAVEATARHTLTSIRKVFRGVLEWLRFTDRISASEFDGAWGSVNHFLTKGSFEKYARDQLHTTADPAPAGSIIPERKEKKVAEARCPEKYKHHMYQLAGYVEEKVQAFGGNQVLDATFGACIWLQSTGKCLQLIAAMSAGKRMDECHITSDSGAGHTLLENMLPNALESIQNMDMDVGATLSGAFRSIHGGRASYVNEDHTKVLDFWRSQVDREVPAAVDQHNAIMQALEEAAKNAMQAASQVPCASYVNNKDL